MNTLSGWLTSPPLPALPPLHAHLSTKSTAVPELPHEVGHKKSSNTEDDREESCVWETEHVEPMYCSVTAVAGMAESSQALLVWY